MGGMDEPEPVEGIDVPRTNLEFDQRFDSEAACRRYLERARWPDGFVCPNPDCVGRSAWLTARGLHRCAACGRQTSATAGTILAGTRKPLRAWFEVLWLVAGNDGVSAETVRTALGLGSYQTAWAWLHKIRRALATVALESLTGIVELGVIDLKSVESSARRTSARPTLVAMALEVGEPNGRLRLSRLANRGPASVERFASQAVAPRTRLRTTAKLRPGLIGRGYLLDPVTAPTGGDVGLPSIDVVARLLDEWVVGTHHGAIRRQQLDFYLAEFAFRFNERASPPGLRFDRLLEAALAAAPRSARSLVGRTVARRRRPPGRRPHDVSALLADQTSLLAQPRAG